MQFSSLSCRSLGSALLVGPLLLLGACGDGSGGSAGTGFANLNPTQAGYAATTASQVANARPQAGSVTQSSNVSNSGITKDRVTVTAQHGASRNNYRISKVTGDTWLISTDAGNPVTIHARTPFDGQELYNRVNGGTLYVDVYSDIEAPTTRQVSSGQAVTVIQGDNVEYIGSTFVLGRGQSTNGELNGQSGTFTCAQTGCSVSFRGGLPNQGSPIRVNTVGGITFIPNTTVTTVTTPDTDYLAGGVWLFLPDDVMSADDLEIGAFGDGSDPFHQSKLMALQGRASYDGMATGIYTDKSEGEVGYWDSSVSLTADFGSSNALGTISGSLSNFEANGESLTGNVSLGTANIGSSDSGFFEGDLSGTVEGIGLNGLYGGQFFGNSEADGKPGSVGGTLGATSSDKNNSFVGVFGAYKQ